MFHSHLQYQFGNKKAEFIAQISFSKATVDFFKKEICNYENQILLQKKFR